MSATIRVYAPGRLNSQREAWQTEALCAQTIPEAFTLDDGQSSVIAKQICAACPVADACLEYAMKNNFTDSIYGGLGPRQRRRLKTERAVA